MMSPETMQAVMAKRFSDGTTPRSPAYRLGYFHALAKAPDRERFKPGSAEFDAYWAGYDDGRNSGDIYASRVTEESER